VDESAARNRLAAARVARLATTGADGRVDLVPVTFTMVDGRFVTAVDHKPKSTMRLKRLDNVRAEPRVSLIVDHYEDDDWFELWWVRAWGRARVLGGGSEWATAIAALVDKYAQYRIRAPEGDVIIVEIDRLQWWAASEG
jgi:PPOX class probable F420-dependent enzyme